MTAGIDIAARSLLSLGAKAVRRAVWIDEVKAFTYDWEVRDDDDYSRSIGSAGR